MSEDLTLSPAVILLRQPTNYPRFSQTGPDLGRYYVAVCDNSFGVGYIKRAIFGLINLLHVPEQINLG